MKELNFSKNSIISDEKKWEERVTELDLFPQEESEDDKRSMWTRFRIFKRNLNKPDNLEKK